MCGGSFSAGVRVPGNGPHNALQSPMPLWCDARLQKDDSGGEGRLIVHTQPRYNRGSELHGGRPECHHRIAGG
jgi:hypothetical protein